MHRKGAAAPVDYLSTFATAPCVILSLSFKHQSYSIFQGISPSISMFDENYNEAEMRPMREFLCFIY